MTLLPDSIPIYHLGERLIVIEKPSGLLAVPGRGEDKQDCASARLQAVHPEALVVHRLDRDTSGLMLFARDAAAHRELSRQFEQRLVCKEYEAVVEGLVEADAGEIDLPLRKCFDRPPRHRVDLDQGKPALTHWRVIERYAETTRLLLLPQTGRSHQLRIHMQQLTDRAGGHPIVGDPLYGTEESPRAESRLMLHATMLEVMHPDGGERIGWRSECPF